MRILTCTRAAALFGLMFSSTALAQSGSWSSVAAGGNWSNAANWANGIIANGAGNTATFATPSLTVPVTVTLDSSRTIGALVFDNPTNNLGWTLRNNTLTLSSSATPSIAVNNANITATVTSILAGNQGFIKAGAGTLSLSANNTGLTGGITVSGGVLAVTGSATINPLGNNGVTLSGGTLRLGGSGGGFNQRMVVPVGTTWNTSGITATMDGGTSLAGNTWYEVGQNVNAPATGLPMGTSFQSVANPQFTYTLQPATQRNAILLDNAGGNTTGRFTLETPTTLDTVSLLTSSGNGAGTITATLHYSDGTPDATGLTVTSPDWFNNNPVAIIAAGRINSGGYDSVNTANPRLYDGIIANPNPASPISSIDLSWTGGANTHTAVFGIANATVLNGDPAQNFTNAVNVTADSTIDVRGANGASLGNVSIGSNTLNVTGLSGVGLTVGTVTATGGNPTINTDTGLTVTTGALADGGTARTFTKAGTGTLALGAASPGLTAGTNFIVNAGAVNVNNATALGTGTNLTVNSGAVNFGTGVSATLASLSGPGGIVNLNGNTLTLGATNGNFGGVIADGSGTGALVKAGPGTQTLSGPNSFTGGITVSGGKLAFTKPAAAGTNTINLNGGTLSLAGVPAGTITGFGGTGSGWTPNGTATFPGGDVLQLTANNGGQAGSAWFNNPVSTNSFTISFRYTVPAGSAPPADGFTVTFQNQGTNALGGGGGELGYSNITPSAALAVNIYPPNTIGGAGSGYSFVTNGTPPNAAPVPSIAPVDPGLINMPTDIVFTYDGTNATVTFTQGANMFSTGPVAIDIPGVVGTTALFGFTGATGGLFAQQQISNLTTTFPVGAQDTYANNVNLAAGTSTIAIAATSSVPTLTLGTLTTAAGSTLVVSPDTGTPANQAFGLNFGATTLNGATTFTVNNNGAAFGTVTLGATGGAGSLTKSGAGVLVLPNANTYAGGTTINGGRLLVTNTSGSATGPGTVTVNSGGTLGGTGTVGANVQVNAGGNIEPGSPMFPAVAPGILTVNGNVTYTGGTFTAKLNGTTAGTGYDQLHVLGTVSLGNQVAQLSTSLGYAPSAGDSLTLIQGGTVDAGRFLGLPDNTSFLVGSFGGTPYTAVIHYTGSTVVLSGFQPVPEPVHLLLVGGLAGLAFRWRRRRQAHKEAQLSA